MRRRNENWRNTKRFKNISTNLISHLDVFFRQLIDDYSKGLSLYLFSHNPCVFFVLFILFFCFFRAFSIRFYSHPKVQMFRKSRLLLILF
jgi:hypothetical protein